MCGRIQHDRLWVEPNGGWDGPTQLYPSLASVKMSMSLGEPEDRTLRERFASTCQNLGELLDDIAAPDSVSTGVLIADHRVQTRHCMFMVCSPLQHSNFVIHLNLVLSSDVILMMILIQVRLLIFSSSSALTHLPRRCIYTSCLAGWL